MNKAQLNDVKFPVLGTAALVPAEAPALILIEGGKSRAADDEFTSRQPSQRLQSQAAVVGFIFAAVLCIALLGALRCALLRSSIEQKLVSMPTCTVRVLEGESLWTVAQAHGVEGVPTSDVVAWIQQANDLDGSCVSAGQSLTVPMS